METAKETKRIGFVCFVAAFIGTFLTLAAAIEFGLGWWLALPGALVSGGVAALIFCWREVPVATRAAWQAARRIRPPSPEKIMKIIVVSLTLALGLMALLWPWTSSADSGTLRAAGDLLFWCVVGLFAIVAGGLVLFVAFLLLLMLVGVICRAASFIWLIFLYLHREERRICFTGTAIGVLAGFTAGWQSGVVFLGSLVGGAVGCLVGILEYELVARRWLKLLPVAERT